MIQAAAAFAFAAHFALLGAFTGAGMNLIEVPRNLMFSHRHGKLRQNILAAVFMAAFFVFGIFAGEDVFSFFPVLAMGISTFVFTMQNPRNIRFCMLPVSALWMTYNIIVLSFAGVLTESFCLFSILIAIVRFDILKKPEK